MKTIAAAIQAIAAFLGFAQKKQELNNTPEMQAAKRGKSDQQIRAETTKAVASNDLDAIRKGASE